jgi:hypothetical protein
MLDYPMLQAQNFAKLMQGYSIPTDETTQKVGSEGYSASPLSQVSSLLAALASYNPQSSTTKPTGKKDGGLMSSYADGGEVLPDIPDGAAYHDGQGNFYDQDGYLMGY